MGGRVALRDDRLDPSRDAPDRVQVALDDDGCAPCRLSSGLGPAEQTETDPGSVLPVLTVRLRERTGYDDDGNPKFSWTTVAEGPAIVFTRREEFDADAGFTQVFATGLVMYDGDLEIPETASVVDDDGTLWRVLAVRQQPGSLGFDLERIAAETTAT